MVFFRVVALGLDLYRLGKEALSASGSVQGAKVTIQDHRARLVAKREEVDRRIAEAERPKD